MYIFLHERSPEDVVNNVFDQKEYTRALKERKNNFN